MHLDTQIIDDNYIKNKKASLTVDAYYQNNYSRTCSDHSSIFVQSYYFSKQIIWQEVDRTKQQTSALILNIFDSHFAAIQIHHNSNSKSDVVLDFYTERDEEALNYFFMSIDQSDPSHTPEFRFLTDHQGIIWDDGNAHFYGINNLILSRLASQVTFSNNWYYLLTDPDGNSPSFTSSCTRFTT